MLSLNNDYFGALILITVSTLMLFTVNVSLYGYNQGEYCHVHYANGTVLCHKMPMNMNMPTSHEIK